jgi:hypothetical protein
MLLVGPTASDSRGGGIRGGLRLSRRAIRRRGRARLGGRRGRGRWRRLRPLDRRGRSGGRRRGHRYWSRGDRLLARGDVRRGPPRPRLCPEPRDSGSATERKAGGGRGRGPGGPRVPRLVIVQRRVTSCEGNPEEDGTRGSNRESPTKRHGWSVVGYTRVRPCNEKWARSCRLKRTSLGSARSGLPFFGTSTSPLGRTPRAAALPITAVLARRRSRKSGSWAHRSRRRRRALARLRSGIRGPGAPAPDSGGPGLASSPGSPAASRGDSRPCARRSPAASAARTPCTRERDAAAPPLLAGTRRTRRAVPSAPTDRPKHGAAPTTSYGRGGSILIEWEQCS